MASRNKRKKPAAWKDASQEEAVPEFQPEFLGALSRLVRGSGDGAPDGLLVKVFAKLDQESDVECIGGPVTALASRQTQGKDSCCTEAATRLRLVEKVKALAAAPEGQHAKDPILSAIEKEHAEIEEHAHAKGLAMKELKVHLPKELKGFAGVPALRAGRIMPTRWGLVKLGKSQGVFIEYGTCLETCEKNMLMAFNTKDEPQLETVEMNGRHYWMTRHENHTMAAWRGENDGWLYILVTHCPFRNALALSELLRS